MYTHGYTHADTGPKLSSILGWFRARPLGALGYAVRVACMPYMHACMHAMHVCHTYMPCTPYVHTIQACARFYAMHAHTPCSCRPHSLKPSDFVPAMATWTAGPAVFNNRPSFDMLEFLVVVLMAVLGLLMDSGSMMMIGLLFALLITLWRLHNTAIVQVCAVCMHMCTPCTHARLHNTHCNLAGQWQPQEVPKSF